LARFISYICIHVFHRVLRLLIFFHAKGDAKEKVLYNVEYVVDIPIVPVILIVEIAGVNKKEKGGRKVYKKGDYDPEFLAVIDKKYGGVLNLAIKEQDAVYNDKHVLSRGRGSVEAARPVVDETGNHHAKKCDRADDWYVFKPKVFDGTVEKNSQESIFDNSEGRIQVKIIDTENVF